MSTSVRPDPKAPAKERQGNQTKIVLGALGALIVVFVLTALLTRDVVFVVPVLVAGALWVAFALAGRHLGQRTAAKYSSREEAMSDNTASFPASPLTPDDETPLGDTTEAHDEIIPEDLPLGHPGRQAAEHLAAENGGTTTGGRVTMRR